MTNAEAGLMHGLQLFARYAYPPNERGYCGPADSQELLEYGSSGTVDPGLMDLARAFAGPWPYLTLIAGAAGIDDPFDVRVVEAYWVGNALLERVETLDFGNRLYAEFRPRAGRHWGFLAETIPTGAVCHHSFHVFGVYPWAGLLRSGRVEQPLEVLQQCRIRWGQVLSVEGDHAVVRSRPLTFDGRRLGYGPVRAETVRVAADGLGFVDDLAAGEWVSLHWDWVCDRLSPRQRQALHHYTTRHLEITNDRVLHAGPGMAMS